MISFYKKDDIKMDVMESLKTYPLSHMVMKNTINEAGQTVCVLPPLNISDPESNPKILDMHIHNAMLERERMLGEIVLNFAIRHINEKFHVENESVDFLVKDSAIIPDDRKMIIGMALKRALCGEYYVALHILAPQVENIFRYIAKEAGGLTLILDDDGSSREKVLSSIFDLTELTECYDNNILFLFKGLLNEQARANIRNEIAHGIMNYQRSFSGECVFFICAVIKLLVISSRHCFDISNSGKLQSYKKLE